MYKYQSTSAPRTPGYLETKEFYFQLLEVRVQLVVVSVETRLRVVAVLSGLCFQSTNSETRLYLSDPYG